MKMILILILNLLFMFNAYSSQCDEGNYCDVKKDKDGLKTGVEICKDSNGIVRRKISYQNNEMNGLWECFNEKSKLIESREYKNDKLNGLTKRYQEEFDKYEESRYKDDTLDGENLVFQSSFSGGKSTLTGYSKTSYKNGRKDGFMTMFDPSGKVIKKICYKEDKFKEGNPELCGGTPLAKTENSEPKVDPYKGWKTLEFKSGKLKAKYLLVAYNDIEEAELFYENGKAKANYKRKAKGKIMETPDVYDYKSYEFTGELTAEGECLSSGSELIDLEYGYCYRLSGTRYSFDKGGNLLAKTKYKNGRFDGDSFYYDKDADQVTQITYKDNVKVKLVEKKISTQAILKSEEYYEDGSTK